MASGLVRGHVAPARCRLQSFRRHGEARRTTTASLSAGPGLPTSWRSLRGGSASLALTPLIYAQQVSGSGKGARNHMPGSIRAASSSAEQPSEEPRKRKRGRPRGGKAWNKGMTMGSSHREAISRAMKRRWEEPTHREKISKLNAARAPWNKGITLSDDICEAISNGRMGLTHSPETRTLMSQSHKGIQLSPDTRAKLSEAHKGKVLSEEHKSNISRTQRRRFGARRLYRSIEEQMVLTKLAASIAAVPAPPEEAAPGAEEGGAPSGDEGEGTGSEPPRIPPAAAGAPAPTSPPPPSPSLADVSVPRGQVTREYKALLREYRELQEDLRPWVDAFTAREGRKPGIRDVEASGIEWLLERYKTYSGIRSKLFMGAKGGSLRGAQGAISPPGGMAGVSAGKGGGGKDRSQILGQKSSADRMKAALEYKKSKAGGEAGAAGGAGTEGKSRPAPGMYSAGMGGAGGAAAAAGSDRAKSAMLKALEYKQKNSGGGGGRAKPKA